jgi:hypothetical protein
MAITYNWIISSMEEYPSTSEGLNDVVFIVNWRRTASETIDGKNYIVDTFNQLGVPAPSPEDFTPYQDLTFEQVCGWLDAGLNVEEIDAALAVQLENVINPPVVSLPLPWQQQFELTPEPESTPEPTRTLPESEIEE